MDEISEEVVAKGWRRMNRLSRQTGLKMAEQMSAAQPDLTAYLLGVDEDVLNEEERAHLFFMGMGIWHIMGRGGAVLPVVTVEALQKAEAANVALVEQVAAGSTKQAEAIVTAMLHGYRQSNLLGSVIADLAAPDDPADGGGASVREDSLGLLMIDLKTVIDVLDS